MGRNKAAKAASVPAAKAASVPAAAEAETLGDLLTAGPRPRWDDEPKFLWNGIVTGYLPPQANEPEDLEIGQLCQDKQSEEITNCEALANSPIGKQNRRFYNWCAESTQPGLYTLDPEKMQPCGKFSNSKCDICGKGEKLYSFRAWEKKDNRPDDQQDPRRRKLHRVIAYFGKDCGRGLLGRRTDGVKILEKAQELLQLSQEQMQEEIQSLKFTATQHISLQRAIRRLTGQSEGSNPELKALEVTYGQLPKPEDPFRAIRRCLGYAVQHRELAAITAAHLKRNKGKPIQDGFLMKVIESLEQQAPLPSTPQLPRSEVQEALQQLVEALPCLQVELHETAEAGVTIFKAKSQSQSQKEEKKSKKSKKEKNAEPAYTVCLVYLTVAHALHANPRHKVLGPKLQSELAKVVKKLVKSAPESWTLREGTSAGPVGYKGPRRAEDALILVPTDQVVTSEMVLRFLSAQVSWPACTSRKNVTPVGQPSIEAFCVGLLKPWFRAEMAISRWTHLLPNLARNLALFARQIPEEDPRGFKFSTIQLNKNYNARLHVDKNNHGLSWIIGLGSYSGGQLWVYDANAAADREGVYWMKVEAPLRGYPFQVGEEIPGRLHDIHDKWLKFDGRVPHAALPFEGLRISLVYFSRQGSNIVAKENAQRLESIGFDLPTAEWLQATAAGELPPASVVQFQQDGTARLDGGDSSSDDEPDDYGEPDADMEGHLPQRDFGTVFSEHLQVQSICKKSLGLAALGAGCCAAPMAMKLLGFSIKASVCIEDDACIRLAKSLRCEQGARLVETACKDVDAWVKGEGHCEVRHECSKLLTGRQCVFHAVIEASGLSLFAFRQDQEGFNTSKDTRQLRKVQELLKKWEPNMALVEINDLDVVYATYQRSTKDILDFLCSKLTEGGGYMAEFAQVNLREFCPLTGTVGHLLLSRKDFLDEGRLKSAADLARGLGAALPQTRVQDFLLGDSDPELMELQRRWSRNASQAPPSEYSQFLKKRNMSKAWYFSATSDEQKLLTQAFSQLGAESPSAFLDLTPRRKLQAEQVCDDGHLPGRASQLHYCFHKHRPLTGREEMTCRGYSCSLASLRGAGALTDQELRKISAKAPVLPATAASLCAMLALGNAGELLSVPREHLDRLIQVGSSLPKTAVQLLSMEAADPLQAKLEMKAAVCLALLGRTAPVQESAVKKGKEKNAPAAEEDEELVGKSSDDQQQLSLVSRLNKGEDEEDWRTRARKARFWGMQDPTLTFERVLRWVAEAAGEPENQYSEEILNRGLRYLKLCLVGWMGETLQLRSEEEEKSSHLDQKLIGLSENFDDMLPALQQIPEAFQEARKEAYSVYRLCAQSIFRQGVAGNNPRVILGGSRPISEFVNLFMKNLDAPLDLQICFEHMHKRLPKLKQEGVKEFATAGGPEAFIELVQKIKFKPQDWSKLLPELFKRQEINSASGIGRAVLLLVQKDGWRQWQLARALDEVVLGPLLKEMQNYIVSLSSVASEQAKAKVLIEELTDAASSPTPLEQRLLSTAKALEKIFEAQEALRRMGSSIPSSGSLLDLKRNTTGQAEEIVRNAKADMLKMLQLQQAPDIWAQLAQMEDKLITEANKQLEAREKEAQQRAEKARREEEDAKKQQQEQKKKKDRSEAIRKVEKLLRALDAELVITDLDSSGKEIYRLKAAEEARNNKDHDMAALGIPMIQWSEAFVTAVNNCGKVGIPDKDLPTGKELPEKAKLAFKSWQERDGRLIAFRNCLRDLHLPEGAVSLLLQDTFVERISDVAKHPALLDGLCLPPGVVKKLVQAAKDQKLTPEPVLPLQWGKRQSSGKWLHHFFNSKGPDQTPIWYWPERFKEEALGEPWWPRPRQLRDPHSERFAKYMSPYGEGKHWCYLCSMEANMLHVEDSSHRASREAWKRLTQTLEKLCGEVTAKELKPDDGVPHDYILHTWQEYILGELKETAENQWAYEVFVRTVLEPHWPVGSAYAPSSIGLLQPSLQNAIQDARLEEPTLIVYPQLPQPGEDFQVVHPSSGRLPPITYDEAGYSLVRSLQPEDLLLRGLVLQESGRYICLFCQVHEPVPVANHLDELVKHLAVDSKAGNRHKVYMDFWASQAQFLRNTGWQLKDKGCTLRGSKWQCQCGKQGDIKKEDFAEHFPGNHHSSWEMKNPSNTPQAVKDKLRSYWHDNFDKMCANHQESLLQLVRQRRAVLPAKRQAEEVLEPAPSVAVPSVSPPRKGVQPEPPLPTFEDFPNLSGGMFQKGEKGQVKCLVCKESFSQDLLESHKTSRNHKHWAPTGLHAFQLIKKHGHAWWRHGMAFKDGWLVCGCSTERAPKKIEWFQMANWFTEDQLHVNTKHHKQWRAWNPEPPEQPWEEERRQRWLALFNEEAPKPDFKRPAEPVEAPKPDFKRPAEPVEAPKPDFKRPAEPVEAPTHPDVKRLRTEPEEDNMPSSSSRPWQPVQSLRQAKANPQEFGTPTEKEMNDAEDLTVNRRHFPELERPLRYGWLSASKKNKDAFIWCCSCKVWVGLVAWDGQHEYKRRPDQGWCPHWQSQQSRFS